MGHSAPMLTLGRHGHLLEGVDDRSSQVLRLRTLGGVVRIAGNEERNRLRVPLSLTTRRLSSQSPDLKSSLFTVPVTLLPMTFAVADPVIQLAMVCQSQSP